MMPPTLPPLANHLWQSSLFAGVAGLLSLALRGNQARIRYRLWQAASLKFLIPFSTIAALTGRLAQRRAPVIPPMEWPAMVRQAAIPFATPASVTPSAPTHTILPVLAAAAWAVGAAILLAAWSWRWWKVRAAVRSGSPVNAGGGLRAVASPAIFEPGVFGIFRPVLMLPAGVDKRLTPGQLQAIVAHERCHIQRRDNLAAVLHMGVQAIFWFYPVVWWLGARLLEERERACDEEVIRAGIEPMIYAEGILQVCDLYLESPLACVAGVTGSNLKKRIEQILDGRLAAQLGSPRKLLLAVAAALALLGPVLTGVVNAPRLRAQSQAAEFGKPSGPKFELASVKPAPDFQKVFDSGSTPHIGMKVDAAQVDIGGYSLKRLLMTAFSLQSYQLTGPDWLDTERFDVLAKLPEGATKEQVPQMLQWLLAERFGLVAHGETKDLPAFVLVCAKDGPKMKPSDPGDDPSEPGGPVRMTPNGGLSGQFRGPFGTTSIAVVNGVLHMEMSRLPMAALAKQLVNYLGGPVVDKTGLSGNYQVVLDFSVADTLAASKEISAREMSAPQSGDAVAVAPEPPGTSVFSTVQRLGLRIERQKAPLPMLIVDHVERKPKEN